ncbi:unnamed protein product [Adineta ricciae]|uniref:Uncharacterized protein n=1 Tax=Adineta ricciae TaxID=249248 RepID=A0A815E1N6_ADIRI|nr:unnamed protein product [Adineta ricciae]CAF1308782.1 unnamed protein product [Adineta ricciae]
MIVSPHSSQSRKSLAIFAVLTLLQILTGVLYKISPQIKQGSQSFAAIVFYAEVLKLFISTVIIYITADSQISGEAFDVHRCVFFRKISTISTKFCEQVTWRFLLYSAGIASLYCCNNSLLISSSNSMDSTISTLATSVSIPFTLLILSGLCDRCINHFDWIALSLQLIGLGISQYNGCQQSSSQLDYIILITMAILTAVSRVGNEYCVKYLNIDLQVQNLVLYSLNVMFHFVLFYKSLAVLNYSWWMMAMSVCYSLIGLIVSAVYKYSDIFMQLWSFSCATVVLILCNSLLFGSVVDAHIYAGVLIVLLGFYLFILQRDDFAAVPIERTVTNDEEATRSSSVKIILLILFTIIGYFTLLSTRTTIRPIPFRNSNTTESLHTTTVITKQQVTNSFFQITRIDPIRLNRPLKIHGIFNVKDAELQLTVNAIKCSLYYFSNNETICNAPDLIDKLPRNATVEITVKARYGSSSIEQKITVARWMTHWEREHILLLICFGQARYERIAFLSMFEDLFPKVIYAGPTAGENIVLCPELPWRNHVCMSRVIEQYPNYNGYLYQTFDTGVILFNLFSFDLLKIWRAKDYRSRDPPFGSPVHEGSAAGWMWNVHPVLADTKKAFAIINSESQKNTSDGQRYRRYMKNLVTNAGAADMRLGSFSDLYYIPKHLTNDWLFLAGRGGVFDKCNVIHEIVSPTISWMITDKITTKYQTFEGSYSTDASIQEYLRNPHHHYFHRVNLTDKNERDFVKTIKEKSHVYV